MSCSIVGALMHLIRSNMGPGIYSLPWAMSHAGIVVGPALLVCICILSTTTMLSLVESSRLYSRYENLISVSKLISVVVKSFRIYYVWDQVGRHLLRSSDKTRPHFRSKTEIYEILGQKLPLVHEMSVGEI